MVIWLCPPQDVQGAIEDKAKFSVYVTDETKQEEEFGIDSSLSRVEYAIPMPWPQDRPPEDSNLGTGQFPDVSVRGKSTFLRDTRCCVAKWLCPPQDVQGATVDSVKSRVVYTIPTPWPQDRPPDDKVFDNDQTANQFPQRPGPFVMQLE